MAPLVDGTGLLWSLQQPDWRLRIGTVLVKYPFNGLLVLFSQRVVNIDLIFSPEKSCTPSRTSKSRLAHFLVATVE